MKLFLDDERNPVGDDWVVVRSFTDAVKWCTENGAPHFISFDHDLGSKNKYEDGKAFCNWLVKTDLDQGGKFLPEHFHFQVHSMNPVGKDNITLLMKAYLTAKRNGEVAY